MSFNFSFSHNRYLPFNGLHFRLNDLNLLLDLMRLCNTRANINIPKSQAKVIISYFLSGKVLGFMSFMLLS